MPSQRQLAMALRIWHRRLGIVVGVQFLLWTIGGIYFSWTDINNIRGLDEKRAEQVEALELSRPDLKSLDSIISANPSPPVKAVMAYVVAGSPVYRVSRVTGAVELYDAVNGSRISPITRDMAQAIARQDFGLEYPIVQTLWVEKAGGEYKGPVPAWRMDFDNWKQSHIYVDASSGTVTARRNRLWRIFDFLWMLHILDFEDRSDINNWLLRLMSIAGLITLSSGYLLWYLTYRIRKSHAAKIQD
ncbi:MAG: PepSY domain-containing protein [Gammaproteobacteria bacterium]|nr:PepSY domain-containing protein [Gammaproteobacteria bacterium]